jgi:hypothetical protein
MVEDALAVTLELYALAGIETLDDVNAVAARDGFSAPAIFWQSASAYVKYALLGVSAVAIVVALVRRVAGVGQPRTHHG